MKLLGITRLPGSVVSDCKEVSFAIDREEAQKLREALAFVQKYEKAAIQAVRHKHYDPRESDWLTISYAVKNDKVIVKIKDGMAG